MQLSCRPLWSTRRPGPHSYKRLFCLCWSAMRGSGPKLRIYYRIESKSISWSAPVLTDILILVIQLQLELLLPVGGEAGPGL